MNTHPNIRLFQADLMRAPRDFIAPTITPTMCLEIGAGKGKHAMQFAAQHPNTHLLAIERTAEKFQAFLKQYQAQSLINLQPIHADAIAWSVHGLKPQQLAQIFILYPNPEPKNLAQRWLNMPFFEFLLSRLQDGGRITLASNIPDYIAEAALQCQNVWQLPFVQETIPAHFDRTHFEIKYLERGEPCSQLIITKPQGYVTRFDAFDKTV